MCGREVNNKEDKVGDEIEVKQSSGSWVKATIEQTYTYVNNVSVRFSDENPVTGARIVTTYPTDKGKTRVNIIHIRKDTTEDTCPKCGGTEWFDHAPQQNKSSKDSLKRLIKYFEEAIEHFKKAERRFVASGGHRDNERRFRSCPCQNAQQ